MTTVLTIVIWTVAAIAAAVLFNILLSLSSRVLLSLRKTDTAQKLTLVKAIEMGVLGAVLGGGFTWGFLEATAALASDHWGYRIGVLWFVFTGSYTGQKLAMNEARGATPGVGDTSGLFVASAFSGYFYAGVVVVAASFL